MKILVIPAIPNTPLRHRAAELAIALGARHRVVVLFGERQPHGLARLEKLVWHLSQAATYSRRALAPGVIAVRFPALSRWPRLSRRSQHMMLAVAARLWRLDVVLTQGTGEVRAPRGVPRIYDIPDDHAAGLELAGRPDAARRVRAFMVQEMRGAAAVTASSRVLVRLAKHEFGRDAVLVPNGVTCLPFRTVTSDAVAALRRRYQLGQGPVLGFTGGVDAWVDAPLMLAALEIVRRGRPHARLLVVGDGARAAELRAAGPAVTVTGFVSPGAVAPYVSLFDVGLVPFVKSRLTDAMLPIKVFDYAAARKPVVSTPLEAYQGEDLPFLRLAEATPDAFAAAVLAALERGWDRGWDSIVDRYDWGELVRVLEGLLDRHVGPREIAARGALSSGG